MPWAELATKTEWYKVINVKDVTTCKGYAKILTLKDREQKQFEAWATSLVIKTIDVKWMEKVSAGKELYIKVIEGKKKCRRSTKEYFDYQYKIA